MTGSEKDGKMIDLKEAYAVFFQALCHDGVEEVIKAASKLFGCPVLLTDENYRLLCQYPTKRLGQDIWDSLYENGALPIDTILAYQEEYLADKPDVYEPFYADWGIVKDSPRIFAEVYTDNHHVLGHVAVFLFDRKLQENDLEVTKILCEAIRIRLSHHGMQNVSNYSYLYDLLDEEVSTQRKKIAAEVLSSRIKGNYCIMVTKIGKSAAQKSFATSIVAHMNTSFHNTVSTIFFNCFVTMIGGIKGKTRTLEQDRKMINTISADIRRVFRYVGVSAPFFAPRDDSPHFYQAYLTASLKREGLTYFTEALPDQVFVPALEYAPLETYVHPRLAEMKEYDRENGTQYFETLRIYSLNMHDKDATAAELHIHRNTLLYRLNRIGDLFGLPFEEKKIALRILNSYQLWNVSEKM